MDANLRITREFRLDHQHPDGTSWPMHPDQHDSAGNDAERSWLHRTIFRCTNCDETVAVVNGADDETAAERP
jgi:hypothetical protein